MDGKNEMHKLDQHKTEALTENIYTLCEVIKHDNEMGDGIKKLKDSHEV